MKILLMGPPASGKGTQGEKLSELLKIPFASTGRFLRAVPDTDPNYSIIQADMSAGRLTDNSVAGEILTNEFSKEIYKNGFVLDGWSRQLSDLQFFNPGFDLVLFFNIPMDASVKRVEGRRVCEKDGLNYNVYYAPPKTENVCDVCGSKLIKRADDNLDILENRYKVYEKLTKPALEYFKEKGILREIDATGNPDEVFELTKKTLNLA